MTKTAADYLREAAEVIDERGKLRDTPEGERSMERAVRAYTTLNGPKMESEMDGWIFMIVLKLARATAGKLHLDDALDGSGYSALLAECIAKQQEVAGETALAPTPVGVEANGKNWVQWKGSSAEAKLGRSWPREIDVEVKLRSGDHLEANADELYWTWNKLAGDIIAYRVVNERSE